MKDFVLITDRIAKLFNLQKCLMTACGVWATLCTSISVAATTPFTLGLYLGDFDGSDPASIARYESAFDAHNAALGGARSKYFNSFISSQTGPDTWVASAVRSAAAATATGKNYLAATSGMTPSVAVPMAWTGLGYSQVDQFYKNTISGDYDNVWRGIVDAWASQGYKTVDFRVAWEMNGNFEAWAPGNSSDPNAASQFVAAFQHVADIVHAESTAQGIDGVVHWNPTTINYTSYDVSKLYPGDAYVDVIGTDSYSPIYTLDHTDWASGTLAQIADPLVWEANPANRAHYWLYPNATQYLPAPGLHNYGWSFPQMIALALAHDKPISIDETGAGPAGSALGYADDPEYPKFLAGILDHAQALGLDVRDVNIWDVTMSDGNWKFSDGSKPLSAAAWLQYFGAQSGTGAVPEPTSWALLLIGFGFVGMQLRRRPQRSVAIGC